jgi:hypothetical protein
LCTRGSNRALLRGPSAPPLDGLVMRIFALVCAILAAALSLYAAFGLLWTIVERTDREALIGVFLLLCLATPLALIPAGLSVPNMRKWPRYQVALSLGTVALHILVWVLWAVVNY